MHDTAYSQPTICPRHGRVSCRLGSANAASSQEAVRLDEDLATGTKVSRAPNGRYWLPRLILTDVAESSLVVSDKQDGKTPFKKCGSAPT